MKITANNWNHGVDMVDKGEQGSQSSSDQREKLISSWLFSTMETYFVPSKSWQRTFEGSVRQQHVITQVWIWLSEGWGRVADAQAEEQVKL